MKKDTKMTEFLTKCFLATASAYLALSTTPEPMFSAVGTAFIAGLITTLLWDAVSLCVKRLNAPDRFTEMVSKRQCPTCEAEKSLELTSDQWLDGPDDVRYREVILACNMCDETYIIEATPPKG